MAWGVKLYAAGVPNQQTRWEIEPMWWRVRDLCSDPRLREVPDGPFGDMAGVLSAGDQREDRARLRALVDVNLAAAPLVAVWVFDWDSGL